MLIIFSYLYTMENQTKAELYGKILELQYENKQLLNQLKIQSNGN